MSSTPRSSSAVNEGDILACGMIIEAKGMDYLFTVFHVLDRCYTLNEFAKALDLSTTDATIVRKLLQRTSILLPIGYHRNIKMGRMYFLLEFMNCQWRIQV